MKIITHNGHFHADDVLGVATLLLIYPDAEIVRTRDEEIIETGDIVVDVGQIYDPEKNRFDHHQAAGAGKRPNNIPYASFGLVWNKFGLGLSGGEEEFKIVEEKLVTPVDCIDNGVPLSVSSFDGIGNYTIGDFFESFSDGKESLEEFDKKFREAVNVAIELLKREINRARLTAKDWQMVRQAYAEAENKKLIILPAGGHWKRVLIPQEALYVVSPRADGQWTAHAVPKAVHSFELKKGFPTSWAGLKGENLASVTGVLDVTFCHKDRFLCGAKSREGAIKLAEIALNA